MPETPEENLSDAIAQQETDRLKALAKREKLERRRQPPTAYYGTDSATGQVRVKPLGAEGVLSVQGLSNAQPSMGQYGRGFRVGADFGNVRKPKIEVFGGTKGEVCVLASVVRDGLIEFWLGGDRKETKIATLPINSVVTHASLELIGPGKNDWIVALRYGPTPETIQMIFGQHTEQNPKNWTITNAFFSYFTYRGNGFWTYGPISALADNRNPSVLVPGADAITLGSQLQLVRTGEHPGQGGESTIEVPYWEQSALPSPPYLTAINSDTYSGLRQFTNSPIPFTFTGENSGGTVRTARAEFEGDCFGPGNLGPAGTQVDPAATPIFGDEALPKKIRSEVTRISQSFSSEFVSWSLFEGVLTPSVGAASMVGSSEETQIRPEGATPRTRRYRGGPTQFTNGWLWTVLNVSGTSWPVVAGSTSTVDNGLTIAKNNAYFVAPGAARNYVLNASSPYTNTSQGTAQLSSVASNSCFNGGFFWSKVDRSGPATLDAFRAEIFTWNAGSTLDIQSYINWQGTDVRVNGAGSGLSRQWQGADPYPKANLVSVPSTILSEAGIKQVDVQPYEGAIVSGTLTYSEGTIFKAKVLSMKAIGVTGQVWMAKHWQKR